MINKMRYIIILLALIAISTLGCKNEAASENKAQDIINQYCQYEFDAKVQNNGILDIRSDIAVYSKKRAKSEKKEFPDGEGELIYLDEHPLYVVKSYKIERLSISDDEAYALVKYKRLARTRGVGLSRKLVSDYKESETVRIQMVYKKGKWWIYDPPLPRVSVAGMKSYYAFLVNDTSDPQTKKVFSETYRILQSLDE